MVIIMKKNTRIVCFLLCLLFLLTACGDKTPSDTEQSSTNPVTEPEPPTETTEAPEVTPVVQEEFVPVFRFLVTSDIHFGPTYPSTESQRFAQLFKSSYKYAESHPDYQSVDALIVVGDFTNNGTASEYANFNHVITENMKEETTLITVMGNHDFKGGEAAYKTNIDKEIQKHVVIKGYHFIGVSPTDGSTYDSTRIKWLGEQLDAAVADDAEKPITTFQHHHIQNTVYVSSEWYTSSSAALDNVYKKYPQILNFSGHSHGPINHPLSVYQKDYSFFGTGTLTYFEMTKGMTYGTLPPNNKKAAQFYIVEYDANNAVRVMPYNLITDDFFKTPSQLDAEDKQLIYYIDKPTDKSTFLYTDERANKSAVPYFPENCTIEVTSRATTRVKIKFSQALDDDCIYSYKLVCTPEGGGNEVEYKLFSEYYFEPIPYTLEALVTGLKSGTTYTVKLIAYDVYGKSCEGKTFTFKTLD